MRAASWRLPIAVCAILFAGSYQQIALDWRRDYEEILSEKTSLNEVKSQFFYSCTELFTQFGLFPGLICHFCDKETQAFMYGVFMILISRILIALFLENNPYENSYFTLFLVSFFGSQGSYVVTISSMQYLYKKYTIVCAPIVSMLMIGYYFGAETYFSLLKDFFAEKTSLGWY